MRRIIPFLLLLFFTCNIVAQEKGTSDIGIEGGVFTTNDILEIASSIIVTGISAGNTTYQNQNETPAILIYYKYALAKRWFVGIDASYQSIWYDAYVNNAKSGKITDSYITFGLGTEYHYVSTEWFQMYSGLSIAYTAQSSKYTGSSSDFSNGSSSFVNFHVNAAGFRFGKVLAGIVELGFGYKGIVTGGISYQF